MRLLDWLSYIIPRGIVTIYFLENQTTLSKALFGTKTILYFDSIFFS